jgi:hypothetical protein
MLRPEHARSLELVFQAINVTVGPCRFEGTTFRSRALAIPLVRRAAEVLVRGSLLRPKLYRDEKGLLYGRLTKHAFWMFSRGPCTSGPSSLPSVASPSARTGAGCIGIWVEGCRPASTA